MSKRDLRHIVPVIEAGDFSPAGSGSLRAYLADCLGSCLFFMSWGNAIHFFFFLCTFAIATYSFTYCFPAAGARTMGFAGICLCHVLVVLFDTVTNAANGDKDLTAVSTDGDVGMFIEDAAHHLFRAVVAFLCAFGPLLGVILAQEWNRGFRTDRAEDVALLLNILTAYGVLTMPVLILVTAVGGLSGLLRPDLIVRTIAATTRGYFVTVAVTAIVIPALCLLVVKPVLLDVRPRYLITNAPHLLTVIAVAYGLIVNMKVIGLYYHHFKDNFAWNWG